MTEVFSTMEEYVDFMTQLPMTVGEAFCLSFLPSAFFPKDAVQLFFQRNEPIKHSNQTTAKLWEHGKRLLRALESGNARMCIETQALVCLCAFGQVHEATPEYEISFAIRVHVLRQMKRASRRGAVSLIPGPIPYTFRLHPPSGVLIDVTRNVAEQNVQGIWINEPKVFEVFKLEFERLEKTSLATGRNPALLSTIDVAIAELSHGQAYYWPNT